MKYPGFLMYSLHPKQQQQKKHIIDILSQEQFINTTFTE